MKFNVEISETYSRVIEVEADNIDDAEDYVFSAWLHDRLTLNDGDFESVDFHTERVS